MTDFQRVEMYCRKRCNALVQKAKSPHCSAVNIAIEYCDMVHEMRFLYGFCPTMFNTYERMPAKVQEEIEREVEERAHDE